MNLTIMKITDGGVWLAPPTSTAIEKARMTMRGILKSEAVAPAAKKRYVPPTMSLDSDCAKGG